MPIDIRREAAEYYDTNPFPLDDIEFYRSRVPSRKSSVLELVMCYYYPDQFKGIVECHGFRIVDRWGG